jgi:hypothetical protein
MRAPLPPSEIKPLRDHSTSTIHKARIGYRVHWEGLFLPYDGPWHWALTLRGASSASTSMG